MLKNKLRVLIIDDSATFCDTLRKMVDADPMLRTVGSCCVREALPAIRQLKPDVISVEPGAEDTDQLAPVKNLIASTAIPVVLISSCSFSPKAVQKLGAKDYLKKYCAGSGCSAEQFELLLHLRLKTHAAIPRSVASASSPAVRPPENQSDAARIIVMGASLGGTEVVMQILRKLPATLPGIVVVQHMPQNFTAAYAERLNHGSAISVKEAANGDRVLPGTALVAPGGYQLTVFSSGNGFAVKLGSREKHGGFCPSVDVLFRSAAAAGRSAVGVILTGMGHDGAEGITLMHNSGAYTIGQNRESCAVFGMPAAANALGGIDDLLGVEAIINKLIQLG